MHDKISWNAATIFSFELNSQWSGRPVISFNPELNVSQVKEEAEIYLILPVLTSIYSPSLHLK